MQNLMGHGVQIAVYPCPVCAETVNTGLVRCPFCSSPLDPKNAQFAADLQARLNQAYNDANHLATMAGVMAVLGLLGLVLPLVGSFLMMGAVVLGAIFPVMAILWLSRYSGLPSRYSEMRQAKTYFWSAVAAWVAAPLFGFLFILLAASIR